MMFGVVAAALLLLIASGTSLAVVHLDALEPLLATCALLVVVIGLSARTRS